MIMMMTMISIVMKTTTLMICGISNDDDTFLATPLHICFWYIDILCNVQQY